MAVRGSGRKARAPQKNMVRVWWGGCSGEGTVLQVKILHIDSTNLNTSYLLVATVTVDAPHNLVTGNGVISIVCVGDQHQLVQWVKQWKGRAVECWGRVKQRGAYGVWAKPCVCQSGSRPESTDQEPKESPNQASLGKMKQVWGSGAPVCGGQETRGSAYLIREDAGRAVVREWERTRLSSREFRTWYWG